jgi:hypothetical protein
MEIAVGVTMKYSHILMWLMVNGETIWTESLPRLKSILQEDTLLQFTVVEPAAGTTH